MTIFRTFSKPAICTTCVGTGRVDETPGTGARGSGIRDCPDCGGRGTVRLNARASGIAVQKAIDKQEDR